MKAVVCQNAELSVRDIPERTPRKGQALLKVLRCGICGCDLHMRHRCDDMHSAMHQSGYVRFPTSEQPLVFGHEFCGEVLDYGTGSEKRLKPGTRVCAVPLLRQGDAVDLLGMSERAPGAYAERVLVQESMMLPIPNGLSDPMAALTEPMALALHAVRRSEIRKEDVAVVMGCGPMGLAVICMLKSMGVSTVVASDFSAAKRQFAGRCGADVLTDPGDDAPFANWAEYGFTDKLGTYLEQTLAMREKFENLPLPWWQSWRLSEGEGRKSRMPVIFECVGQPGVLQTIADGAPLSARVVVVGMCRQPDEMEPIMLSNKELDIRFAKGYSPLEYRDALHLLAEGHVDCKALVTGVVGLNGVDGAFETLDQNNLGKIMIDPSRMGSALEVH